MLRRTLGLGLVILLALTPATARAQGAPPQQGPDPRGAPPPPLFPKHRRGIYRDNQGLEVVDATPQSPPLETDDPGVPDNGEYEINLLTHADLSKGADNLDLLFVDANYGIAPRIAGHELPTQLKFEFPIASTRENSEPFTYGVGAAKAGLKFNFYSNEHYGVSVAFYPQIEFEAPGTRSVEKDLAEPGQTLIFPLLVSREFHYFTFVANGAVNKPLHDPERKTTATFGVGVGRAFTRKVAAMVELRDESSANFKDNHLLFVSGGLIHGVRAIVVYTQVGRSLFSDDGFSHTYLGVGMKLMIHTKTSS